MRPRLLRPPLFLIGRSRDFSGLVRVTSAKSDVVIVRREGVYGRYFLVGIVPPSLGEAVELLDALPGLECDDRLEAVGCATLILALALDLAADVHPVDLGDTDLDDRPDCFVDPGAVGLTLPVE